MMKEHKKLLGADGLPEAALGPQDAFMNVQEQVIESGVV